MEGVVPVYRMRLFLIEKFKREVGNAREANAVWGERGRVSVTG